MTIKTYHGHTWRCINPGRFWFSPGMGISAESSYSDGQWILAISGDSAASSFASSHSLDYATYLAAKIFDLPKGWSMQVRGGSIFHGLGGERLGNG